MKKWSIMFLLSVAATSLFAAEGTITEVRQYAAGGSSILIGGVERTIVGTDDAKRAMLAIALIAQQSGATVDYSVISYNGSWGLGRLFVK